jgi:hypothetical protein
MDQSKLNEELVALHRELGQLVERHETLDGPMIQSLRQVAADIDRVLLAQKSADGLAGGNHLDKTVRTAESAEVSSSSHRSVEEPSPQTLEELAEQFSVDHPETAALLSRLGYLLSNLGI